MATHPLGDGPLVNSVDHYWRKYRDEFDRCARLRKRLLERVVIPGVAARPLGPIVSEQFRSDYDRALACWDKSRKRLAMLGNGPAFKLFGRFAQKRYERASESLKGVMTDMKYDYDEDLRVTVIRTPAEMEARG